MPPPARPRLRGRRRGAAARRSRRRKRSPRPRSPALRAGPAQRRTCRGRGRWRRSRGTARRDRESPARDVRNRASDAAAGGRLRLRQPPQRRCLRKQPRQPRKPAVRAQRGAEAGEPGRETRILQPAPDPAGRRPPVAQGGAGVDENPVVLHLRGADLLARQAAQAVVEMGQGERAGVQRAQGQAARQGDAAARRFGLGRLDPVGRAMRQAQAAHHALVGQGEQARVEGGGKRGSAGHGFHASIACFTGRVRGVARPALFRYSPAPSFRRARLRRAEPESSGYENDQRQC